jgi:hypothetical protein
VTILYEARGQTHKLEVVKRGVGVSIRLENECQDFVDWSAFFKTKEEMVHRVGSINVGALTTLGTFGPSNRRKLVVNLDQFTPYQGATRDERP